MEILDYLFEKGKPHRDESDIELDKTVLDGHEALQTMMLWDTWKGEPRERSALYIAWNGDEWVARLNDGDNRRSSYSTGKSVSMAIESLEHQLVSGQPRWSYWGSYNGKKKIAKSATSSNK